jgi:DNA-binding transcriptional LysR family regulator
VQRLRSRVLDLAFLTGLPDRFSDNVELCERDRGEMGIVLPRSHPLAAQDEIELASLAEFPLVLNSPGYAAREVALELCERAGVQPPIALETASFETLCGLVRAGLGFTVMTRARALHAGLPFARCIPCPLPRLLAVGWLRARLLPFPATVLRDEILVWRETLGASGQ